MGCPLCSTSRRARFPPRRGKRSVARFQYERVYENERCLESAVIGGDGTGPEVRGRGKVLKKVAETENFKVD